MKKSAGRKNTRDIVFTGLLTALVFVFTLSIRIPTVITGGYINPGDIIVIFSGLIFGSFRGAIIGGVGSALADLMGGYPIFVPITLIAKGGEGFIAGLSSKDMNLEKKFISLLFTSIPAGIWMVLSYCAGEWIYLGSAKAITALIPNIIQAFVGIAGALLLYQIIGKKIHLITKE